MTAPNVPYTVAAVTGSRAEFGLLDTVMRSINDHPSLDLRVIVAGAHLLPPAETWRDVAAKYDIAARVPMQVADQTTRLSDASAMGRGAQGFAKVFTDMSPDWVVVLGDRIEAFAAAAAASVAGIAVAHIHGGDRAQGVADEAMRHAITKLAHLHLAATEQSARRITQMGEDPARIFVVGSPALDDLQNIDPCDDDAWRALGEPQVVLLHHPIGRPDLEEHRDAQILLEALAPLRTLTLHPNTDPGRAGVLRALEEAENKNTMAPPIAHLPRAEFLALLKRLTDTTGVLVGNSSAGLIEAAALHLPVVDVGQRQSGRQRAGNVVHVDEITHSAVTSAILKVRSLDLRHLDHPYGDGDAGPRIADRLAAVNPTAPNFTSKHNSY